MKRFFHSELEDFRSTLVLMGERAIEIVRLATEGLVDGQIELCEEALRQDDAIDQLELRIDNEGLRYLSLRAPVATELRLVTIGMKAGQNLERVGDEACTIAKRTRELLSEIPPRTLYRIPRMAELTIEMLRDAIGCLVDEDSEKARRLPHRDDEVDALHRENYRELSAILAREPERVASHLHLIFISKSLERIADHATNLAEEAIFLYRGEDLRHASQLRAVSPGRPGQSPRPL